MSESLDRILEAEFRGVPDAVLIHTIEHAEPFEGDDEIHELNRRLALVGLAWRYSQEYGQDRVVIYKPEEFGSD